MKDKSKKMIHDQKIKKSMDQHKDTSLEEIRQWMDQSEQANPIHEINETAERLDYIQEQLRWLDYDSKEEIEILYPVLQKLADDHSLTKKTFIQKVMKLLGR